MLETWTDTVLVLMKSCLPISPLERPSATSARISPSRGVSVAAWVPVAGAGADPWAVSSSSIGRAPSAWAASRAWSATVRAPAASPTARSTPASRTRVCATSGTLP